MQPVTTIPDKCSIENGALQNIKVGSMIDEGLSGRLFFKPDHRFSHAFIDFY